MQLFHAETISKKFPDANNFCLKNVSFDIFQNDFMLIAGANGSGKTTLMHIVAGLEKQTSGKIIFYPDEKKSKKKLRIGLVFQNADAQILGDTVFDDVRFGPAHFLKNKNEIEAISLYAISKMNLQSRMNVSCDALSGGEKRRLAVASILAMGSEVIIFDEPFANLDFPSCKMLRSVMRDLHNDGKTIICLTHELEKVFSLANRVLVLCEGEKVFDGNVKEVLQKNLNEWKIENLFDALRDWDLEKIL